MSVRTVQIIVVTAVALVLSNVALAQYTILPKPIGNESLVYEQEKIVDIRLHSNGFSLGYTKAQIDTWYRTSYYYFDIGYIKHPKEYSQNFKFFQPGPNREPSRSFIFGKQNQLYTLRAGIGKKRYFSERARRKSVVVGMNYEYGFTLGLLKPYYLRLKRFVDGDADPEYVDEKYSEDNADLFLDETNIFGGASFGTGLDELKLKPGFHGKIGANFSWGTTEHIIKAIEVGIMVDLFLSKVPIMILEENKPYFLNVYLTLQLGKEVIISPTQSK